MTAFMFVLGFLVGAVIAGGIVLIMERGIHAEKKRRDAQEYKTLWTEAVNLLASNGLLTEDQLKKITPKRSQSSKLSTGTGFSGDRRATEIARAKNGLPPADNLKGMFSSDVRAVMEARIKYDTAE